MSTTTTTRKKQTDKTMERNLIVGTEEAWDAGDLGRSEEFMVKSPLSCDELNEKLEMQMISIRLPKSLIEDFKLIAQYHGNSYQALMRQILKRFAYAEMKDILRSLTAEDKSKVGGSDNVRERKSKKAA
jgi:hypothetical protein